MKRLFCLLVFTLLFVICISIPAFADDTIVEVPDVKVNIDAQSKTYSDVTIAVNGRTMLPLRAILTDLGVQNDEQHIIWDNSERSVTIVKDSTKIKLIQGSNIAFVNEVQVTLDAAPIGYSKNGRTYIPARFVAQSLQKKVFWDGTTKTVFIITPTSTAVSTERENLSAEYAGKAYNLDDIEDKPDEAIQCFDIAIELNPFNDQAYYWKGLVLDNKGKLEEAITCYDGAIKANPDHYNAYYEKGRLLAALGKFDDALNCYHKAIEVDKNSIMARFSYNEIGNVLSHLGKLDEAIKSYDMAIQLEPKYLIPYYNKAAALLSQEKIDAAVNCFDKAIEANPTYSGSYIEKGRFLNDIERYVDAIQCFDKAIQMEANNIDAYSGKGISLIRLTKYEEAIKVYDKVLEIDNKSLTAFVNKGNALSYLGKNEEAINEYNKAIEIKPRFAVAYYNRACVYAIMNKPDEAIASLKKAIELDNRYKSAAVDDQDFKNISGVKEFQDLIK